MIQKPTTESVIEEIHRIRREISDRFNGDVDAIAEDAARRLSESGRPIWQPRVREENLATSRESRSNRGQPNDR
jgi:hypothetical protein